MDIVFFPVGDFDQVCGIDDRCSHGVVDMDRMSSVN